MAEKRILILTSDAGLGHRRAAEAVEVALHRRYDDACETISVNPLTHADAPDIIRELEEGYSERVVEDPELYRFSYNAMDLPVISQMVTGIMSRLLDDVLLELAEKHQPHAVVTTYPTYSQPAARAIEKAGLSSPLAVIITDLTDVQRVWYSKDATMHYVPSSAIRQQALDNNIPATRVQVTGLPVHPDFARDAGPQPALRDELGWERDLPAALIVASSRTSQMADIARKLDQARLGVQVAMVCGGDEALHEALQAEKWQGPVHLYGWVDDMPSLMQAADFMISKAGGLIVSEALASGLPIILSEALPGQERGNVRYVVEHEAGAWAPGPVEVLATAYTWLNDSRLATVQQNANRIGHPRAAFDIAAGIRGLMAGASSLPEDK